MVAIWMMLVEMVKKAVPALVKAAGGNRKFSAFIASSGVMLIVFLGVDLDKELKMKLAEYFMAITLGFLGGQGLADVGKEKAKLEKKEEPKEDK